jgi:very-short-patch-repair endonuclease
MTGTVADLKARSLAEPEQLFIHPQGKVGRYRADMVLAYAGKLMCLECDGAAYHKATEQQAEYDRARDDWFRAQGFMVKRVSGKSIYADMYRAAYDVVKTLTGVDLRADADAWIGNHLITVIEGAARRYGNDGPAR